MKFEENGKCIKMETKSLPTAGILPADSFSEGERKCSGVSNGLILRPAYNFVRTIGM